MKTSGHGAKSVSVQIPLGEIGQSDEIILKPFRSEVAVDCRCGM
jgi:hypothetical protein